MATAIKALGNPNMLKGGPSVNPNGVAGLNNSWINPALRARQLTKLHKPKDIIKAAQLIAKGKDTAFSSQDAILIIQLANIYECRDALERERLYDRVFGKVPDKVLNLNLNIDATPDQLSDKANDLLEKLMEV